jgi:AcrR family transcriptional regulator
MMATMSRATRMTADERRAAIVDSTLPVLLAQGPDLSTREIAAAAGVAEGTIFRVFDSKEELIKAVIDAAMRPSTTLAALAALEPQTLDQRTEAVLEILTHNVQRIRSLFSHLAKAGVQPHPPKGHNHDHRDGRAQVIAATATAFADYADQLTVPTETFARLLSAMAFATSFDVTTSDTPASPATLARLVLHGVAKGEK